MLYDRKKLEQIFHYRCWKCIHLEMKDYKTMPNFIECECELCFNGFNNCMNTLDIANDYIYLDILDQDRISNIEIKLEGKPYIVLKRGLEQIRQKQYKVDDCPAFSESQEYHEWKERYPEVLRSSNLVL